MIFKILRHLFASIKTCFQFSVCNIASHNDGTLQVYASANRILGQFSTNSIDTLVEINLNACCALTRIAQLFRNEFCGVGIHLLEEHTVLCDLSLDIAVGRAAYAHTDGAACAVTRQTYHTDVVCQILATKLCTETYLMSLFKQFVLKVDIAECATCLVACGRQTVIILDACQLHGKQVLLGRCTTDNESDVIRRTSCCAQALHLLNEERQQCALVLNSSLGHGIEVCFVGRATTLSNHHETILITLSSLNINLCGQIATGVHLVVHIERSVLRVTQIVLCKGVINAQ